MKLPPLIFILLMGCAIRRPVVIAPAPRTLQSRAEAAGVEIPSGIYIPVNLPPWEHNDLYSATDMAGPWVYRTDDITISTNETGGVIWHVPRTPGATREFYRIDPL